jgi:hypothetical protein
MKRFLIFFTLLQLCVIACFLYFTYQADVAMGKDGIGDLGQSNNFNKYAGYSFYLACILWFLSVLISVIKKQVTSNEALLTVGVPFVAIIVGWLSLWFI